jgi:hypothetical protein
MSARDSSRGRSGRSTFRGSGVALLDRVGLEAARRGSVALERHEDLRVDQPASALGTLPSGRVDARGTHGLGGRREAAAPLAYFMGDAPIAVHRDARRGSLVGQPTVGPKTAGPAPDFLVAPGELVATTRDDGIGGGKNRTDERGIPGLDRAIEGVARGANRRNPRLLPVWATAACSANKTKDKKSGSAVTRRSISANGLRLGPGFRRGDGLDPG